MFFILSKLLLFLFSPFTWIFVFIGLAFFWKRDPWKKRFKWTVVVLILLFSNSFIFLELCRKWEVHTTSRTELEKHDVGIVLTGMAEYNNDIKELSIRRGADRIWQSLNLYHEGKIAKILISGDNGYISDRGLHEAKQMKEILIKWGIPENDIIAEEKSRNTYENAVESKKILERSYPHLEKRLLITSGSHMRRSLACFEKLDFPCTPYSTDLYTGPKRSYHWDQYFVPNVSTLTDWDKLIKEWIGYITYDIVGYI
jgi:uncharacterized SAM-binding protein YcdF (DUF218 family)